MGNDLVIKGVPQVDGEIEKHGFDTNPLESVTEQVENVLHVEETEAVETEEEAG